MINNVTFRLFKLSELFNISGTKTTSLDELREYGIGMYPYVTTQSTNNGVAGFYNFYTEEGNVLTIDSAVAGFCSYHEDNFSASDHVEKLVPKFKMNKNIGLYISSLINKNNYRFSYGRKANQKQIRNIEIPLPIKADNSIDWEYIYIYMQSLENGIKQQIYSNLEVIVNMISKLDTSSWKEFKINSIFNLINCKCSNASELEDGTDLYYVGAKKSDNGVIKKVKYDEELVTKGNCIVFICDGQGSIGFNNYMDQDFIGSTTLMAGYNSNLNKYNGLFIVAVLDLERPKFSFGRKRKKTLGDTAIKLPVDCNGEPDFIYMENFIRNLWGGSLKTSVPYSKVTFNTLEWKVYKFAELFEIERGKVTQLNELENGKCPVVSAYGEKQGIQFFADIKPKYENCITASLNGSGTGYFSYHRDKFEANSDCGVLLPKFKLNKYIGIYVVTIANLNAYRYTYGRKLTIERLKNETIKLPSKDSSPDWDYMEKYIKRLQFSDLI